MITRQRAPRDCAEALSRLLLLTRFEFEDVQGTVGKRSTSALRWCRQREPSESSEPSTIDSDHSDRIIRRNRITQLTDTLGQSSCSITNRRMSVALSSASYYTT